MCKLCSEEHWFRLTDKYLQRLYLLKKLEECATALDCGAAWYFGTFYPALLIPSVVGNQLEKAKLNAKQGERKEKRESKR